MSEEVFGEEYYRNHCGTPMERNAAWLGFFNGIAEQIKATLGPSSVLDAGCAMGFLVESLWDRGIVAEGVDISNYAIERVRPDIRPHCRVASLEAEFKKSYDLIVTIEVLEHMDYASAASAIENFAKSTNRVLFSSTPDDFVEETHFNVLPPHRWISLFADVGFYMNPFYDASYITPHAILFEKMDQTTGDLIISSNAALCRLKKEFHDLKMQSVGSVSRSEYESLNAKLSETQEHAQTIIEEIVQIRNSTSWKITKPLRAAKEWIGRAL